MPAEPGWFAPREDESAFVRRVLIVVAIGALVLLAWHISSAFMLAFGAVVFAVMLRALAGLLTRHTPIPEKYCLAVAGLSLLVAVAAVMIFFGFRIAAQFEELGRLLPETIDSFFDRLRDAAGPVADAAREQAAGGRGDFMARIASGGMLVMSGFANLLLILAAGTYLALAPDLYVAGVRKLFPTGQHERVVETMEAAGEALRLWLGGAVVSMTIVAVLTGLGLWAVGVPYPLALGIIAGFAEFVPFVGPLAAGVVALLAALGAGGNTALWALLVIVAIQQVESYVIQPLVQERAVSLPPALGILAVVAFGLVFGILGVIFAAPLTVVAYVAVKKLYVRETLGEHTDVPGEDQDRASGPDSATLSGK
jgi:predicted PurR-regulated permease PerM